MSTSEIITGLQQRKSEKLHSLNGCAGFFPELRQKLTNDIDTLNRCILKYQSK